MIKLLEENNLFDLILNQDTSKYFKDNIKDLDDDTKFLLIKYSRLIFKDKINLFEEFKRYLLDKKIDDSDFINEIDHEISTLKLTQNIDDNARITSIKLHIKPPFENNEKVYFISPISNKKIEVYFKYEYDGNMYYMWLSKDIESEIGDKFTMNITYQILDKYPGYLAWNHIFKM